MTRRFDLETLIIDLELIRRRKRLSKRRIELRYGLNQGDYHRIITGKSQNFTIHTLVRLLEFLNTTDIQKYIIEEE